MRACLNLPGLKYKYIGTRMTRIKRILCLVVVFFVFACDGAIAQGKMTVADSLWCDHLNEIIKCASLDQISERIGTVRDSSFIPQFRPALLLSKNQDEYIAKQYGKVNYTCYFFITDKNDTKLQQQFVKWHDKLKACLPPWDEARLPNSDSVLVAYPDYFFTNSEDETSVRLDIVQYQHRYCVRLRIY